MLPTAGQLVPKQGALSSQLALKAAERKEGEREMFCLDALLKAFLEARVEDLDLLRKRKQQLERKYKNMTVVQLKNHGERIRLKVDGVGWPTCCPQLARYLRTGRYWTTRCQ